MLIGKCVQELYSGILQCKFMIMYHVHHNCACRRQYRKYVGFLVPAVGLSDLKDRRNGSENACIM